MGTLCNLTGQHMYFDVDPLNILDPIRLFAFVGNSGSPGYSWNIKITSIDCKLDSDLQAPSGCLQYFPETSGSFESLNYGGGSGAPYLANTKYAVCFRGAAGFCGIKFSALPGEFILNSNNGLQDVGEGSECHNYTVNSNNDFLQVLGAWTLLGTNKVEDAYFCGGTTSEARSDIYASGGPLVVLVQTDDGVKFADGLLIGAADAENNTQTQIDLINARERGFRLSYTLTPC